LSGAVECNVGQPLKLIKLHTMALKYTGFQGKKKKDKHSGLIWMGINSFEFLRYFTLYSF
jgi:hypothetical protein